MRGGKEKGNLQIEIYFDTKKYDKNNFKEEIFYKEVQGTVEKKDNECTVKLNGDSDSIIDVFRLVWELLFLYEGYFYLPKIYRVDGYERKPEELYFLSYYKAGKTWRDCAVHLNKNSIDLTTERLTEYDRFRNTSRDSGKLLKTLINAFFYLHSEAYEGINVDHRLSLFLNLCDGYIINTRGKSNNVMANIKNVLGENLDVGLIKYGASLLGIPKGKLYETLADERNEIDHYDLQKISLTSYVLNSTDNRAIYITWYFVYVIELALRIGFLQQIGFSVEDERKIYAMNEINDWVINGCNLEEECKNPYNKMKQDLKRQGITMQ